MLLQILPDRAPVKVVGALMAVLTPNTLAGPRIQLFRACTDIFPPLNPEAKLTVMLVVPWPAVIVAPVGTVHT